MELFDSKKEERLAAAAKAAKANKPQIRNL